MDTTYNVRILFKDKTYRVIQVIAIDRNEVRDQTALHAALNAWKTYNIVSVWKVGTPDKFYQNELKKMQKYIDVDAFKKAVPHYRKALKRVLGDLDNLT